MTNNSAIGKFVARQPALPSSAQPWAKEMERRLLAVENKASNLAAGSAKVGSVLAAWTPLVGKITGLESGMSDAGALGLAANEHATDAVTWSTERPLSPDDRKEIVGADIPLHDDATWFVYEMVNNERQVKEIWRWSPPTHELIVPSNPDEEPYLDSQGEWVQQRFGIDTLGEGAVDIKNLSAALSGDLTERAKAVEDLQKRQSEFQTQYESQQKDLLDRIAKLQVEAGTDGRVIISTTEPQGADRHEGNLWINTTNGGSVPYRYDRTSDTWVQVSDPRVVEAANRAAQADANAEVALKRAQEAQDKATAAELAATSAQTSANSKNRIFYSRTKPTLSGRVDGDLWFDAANGYQMYTYSESAQDFVAVEFKAGLSDEERRDIENIRNTLAEELGSVTANGVNRIKDPEFHLKWKYWQENQEASANATMTNEVKFRTSEWVQKLNMRSLSTVGVRNGAQSTVEHRIACVEGETLTLSAWVMPSAPQAITGTLEIQLLGYADAAYKSVVTTGTLAQTDSLPQQKWMQLSGTVVIPEGVNRGAVRVVWRPTAGQRMPTSGACIYVGRVEATAQMTRVNIADNSITAPKIVAGAITADKIAANAITAEKIMAGSIVSEKIAALAITTDHLRAGAVTAEKVDVYDLQAKVVRTAELDAGNITTGVLSADRLAAGSITSAKLNVGDIQANVVKTATIDAGQIKTGTLDAALVTADTLRGKTLRIDGRRAPNAFIEMSPTMMGGRIHGSGGTGITNGGRFSFGHDDNGMPHLHIYRPDGTEAFLADGYGVRAFDTVNGGVVPLSRMAQSWVRRFETPSFTLPRRTAIGSWAFYQVNDSLAKLSFSFTSTSTLIRITNTTIFDQAFNGSAPLYFVAQVGIYTTNSANATANLVGSKAYCQTLTTGNITGGGQMTSTTEVVEVPTNTTLWVKPISRFINTTGNVQCNNWRSSIVITYP